MSRDHTSTPSVIANAATSAATPMITPVVESTVRIGLARRASAPIRPDSISAARFIRASVTGCRVPGTVLSEPRVDVKIDTHVLLGVNATGNVESHETIHER